MTVADLIDALGVKDSLRPGFTIGIPTDYKIMVELCYGDWNGQYSPESVRVHHADKRVVLVMH